MCLNPIRKTEWIAGRCVVRTFACGKCAECLKRKQSDYAVGSIRTAQHYGFDKVEFVTLTYRPASIPVLRTDYIVDDTGELLRIQQDFVPDRKKLCKSHFTKKGRLIKRMRDYQENNPLTLSPDNIGEYASILPRDFSSKVSLKVNEFNVGTDLVYSEYCHSLCRKDLRLSLKRAREAYKYKHGVSLPEFKYLAVGEYGKLGRPHYHLLIFGLSHLQAVELFQDWKTRFGHIYIKHVVPAQNSRDYATAVQKTARYVSKYITKGCFDDSKVLSGVAEKPRKMASLDFGFWNPSDKEQSWFLGYDIVGHPYNVDTFKGVSVLQVHELLPRIVARMNDYRIDGQHYIFPKPLKSKLLNKYEISYKKDGRYCPEGSVIVRASSLSRLVSAFIQNNADKDFMQKLRQMASAYPDETVVQISRRVTDGEEIPRLKRAKDFVEDLLKSYNTSSF